MESTHKEVRKPAVAGLFYPSNPVELSKTIAGFYAETDKVALSGRPIALIVPHAGYPYSGRTAVRAYKLLEGEQFDTVVVISPSHTVFFQGSSVYGGDGYETPLGIAQTERSFVERLAARGGGPRWFAEEFAHRDEHSIEFQVLFLQYVMPDVKIVPVLCSFGVEDWKKDRDYINEQYRACTQKEHKKLQGIALFVRNYKNTLVWGNDTSLFYCDPPYEDTKKYRFDFNHKEFWNVVREQSIKGKVIFVSSYKAPDDFVSIWEKERTVSINTDNVTKAVEKLFIHKSF